MQFGGWQLLYRQEELLGNGWVSQRQQELPDFVNTDVNYRCLPGRWVVMAPVVTQKSCENTDLFQHIKQILSRRIVFELL